MYYCTEVLDFLELPFRNRLSVAMCGIFFEDYHRYSRQKRRRVDFSCQPVKKGFDLIIQHNDVDKKSLLDYEGYSWQWSKKYFTSFTLIIE